MHKTVQNLIEIENQIKSKFVDLKNIKLHITIFLQLRIWVMHVTN